MLRYTDGTLIDTDWHLAFGCLNKHVSSFRNLKDSEDSEDSRHFQKFHTFQALRLWFPVPWKSQLRPAQTMQTNSSNEAVKDEEEWWNDMMEMDMMDSSFDFTFPIISKHCHWQYDSYMCIGLESMASEPGLGLPKCTCHPWNSVRGTESQPPDIVTFDHNHILNHTHDSWYLTMTFMLWTS